MLRRQSINVMLQKLQSFMYLGWNNKIWELSLFLSKWLLVNRNCPAGTGVQLKGTRLLVVNLNDTQLLTEPARHYLKRLNSINEHIKAFKYFSMNNNHPNTNVKTGFC